MSWTITAEERSNRLTFKWQETGGPPVTAPERSGFGTSLLKAIFANARFDYAVEGLVCEIEVLLEDNKPGTMRAAELSAPSVARPVGT